MTAILGISGSLRAGSFNRRLLELAAEVAPSEVAVTIEPALDALPLFDEDLERATGGGPAVHGLRARVRAADALLIATPEYNRSIPGGLKNAIDWLSRPGPDRVLAGKPVAVIGATTGPWGTRLAQSHLREVLAACEAQVVATPALFVREAAARIDDPAARATLRAIVSRIGNQDPPPATGG
jgi:chromate reductase